MESVFILLKVRGAKFVNDGVSVGGGSTVTTNSRPGTESRGILIAPLMLRALTRPK